MKNFKAKTAIFTLILFSSTPANAGKFSCDSEKKFCEYSGKISSIFVNIATPLFRVSVDADLTVAAAAEADIALNVDQGTIAIDYNDLELAKIALSTLQVAFVANKNVTIRVQGKQQGFPKFVQVWVAD